VSTPDAAAFTAFMMAATVLRLIPRMLVLSTIWRPLGFGAFRAIAASSSCTTAIRKTSLDSARSRSGKMRRPVNQ
jgi:hypothetical protein